MNIELPLRTKHIPSRLLLSILFVVSLLFGVKAQETDTIIPVDNPDKVLKKLKLGKIEDGFNLWQDKFKGHWAGVDFGFNTFVKEDYSGYVSEFMDNDVFRSNTTSINLFQQSIGIQKNRNTIGLITGLGLQLQSYRLDDNTTIYRNESTDVIFPQTLVYNDNQKSKLSIVSLIAPLLTEFQIPLNHYQNRIYISAGLYGNLRLSSHTKIKYRIDRKEKLKKVDHYSLQKFEYGIMIRTGYRWFNIFATYDLRPLFKEDKGPELKPITFGITLLQF